MTAVLGPPPPAPPHPIRRHFGGAEAWGQVAASRKPVKTVAQAATARGVREVIVVRATQTKRWREVVEGDIVKDISRKLGPEVNVEGVSP